jgi:hypothetical protein
MELYAQHLVDQWSDRQVYDHMQDLSRTCMRMVRNGNNFGATLLSSPVLTVIVDGMDQAKFRVPRCVTHSHAFEKLLRPALHVQGIWAHGAGYQIAVSDADLMKDTAGNCEVISRMIETIYKRHGALPLGLCLQQDNTSRECKNQKMMKFAISLVALGVFRWVTLSYLVTGHTHTGLDATFGQLAVKLSHEEFDDDRQCVELLRRFVTELGIDAESRSTAWAYKLDEVAQWGEWWDQLGVSFNNLTGPDAPHYFRLCLRSDVGRDAPLPHNAKDELSRTTEAFSGCSAKPGDVMLVVKARTHSFRISQIICVLPEHMRRRMLRIPSPRGLHPRRPGGEVVKAKCAKVAAALGQERVISSDAVAYLVGWATGTRAREPRPQVFEFLSHRWQPSNRGPNREPFRHDGGSGHLRRVRVSIVGLSEEDPEDLHPLIEVRGD